MMESLLNVSNWAPSVVDGATVSLLRFTQLEKKLHVSK